MFWLFPMLESPVDIARRGFAAHLTPVDNRITGNGYDPLPARFVQTAPDFLPAVHWQFPPRFFALPVFPSTQRRLHDSARFFLDDVMRLTLNLSDPPHFGDPLPILFRFRLTRRLPCSVRLNAVGIRFVPLWRYTSHGEKPAPVRYCPVAHWHCAYNPTPHN